MDITADLIVNHVSIHSPQFKDFLQQGDLSPSGEIFLTYCDVFPQGGMEQDLVKISSFAKSVEKRKNEPDDL